MRWLLDTNVWIDEALGYSGITPADDKALRELLAQFEEVQILPAVIDEAIHLRRLHKLKSPDAIIAATAVLQQAKVVTRNTSDFKKVAGLSVLDTQSF